MQFLAPLVVGSFYGVVLRDAGVEVADGSVAFVGDGGKSCCSCWLKLGVRGCRLSAGMAGGWYSSGDAAGGHDGDAQADSASAQASIKGVVVCIGLGLLFSVGGLEGGGLLVEGALQFGAALL